MHTRIPRTISSDIPPRCRRCGICCRKGGPALHLQDRELVVSGKIPLKALFTIRRGEPAYDNVRGMVAPAATDIIKIKSGAGSDASACRYFTADPARCGIYADRPVECRALTCWDTRAITALYDQERLTRAHLLEGVDGLSDLIADHQQRCDGRQAARLAEAIRRHRDAAAAVEALLDMLRYDQSLRQVTVERARVDPQLLDFLFGRPLTVLLPAYHLRLAGTPSRPDIVALYQEAQ
jgi:Fe-S-cluster containining protein